MVVVETEIPTPDGTVLVTDDQAVGGEMTHCSNKQQHTNIHHFFVFCTSLQAIVLNHAVSDTCLIASPRSTPEMIRDL